MATRDNHKHTSRSRHAGHHSASDSAACAGWAMLLPDAVEGLLSPAEEQALELHLGGCPRCAEEMLEAQRGLAWLTVLKEQPPEPPADLLTNILAQTTGLAEVGVSLPEPIAQPVAVAVPVGFGFPSQASRSPAAQSWFPHPAQLWEMLMQPRLAMTTAMAFFSICLTLNLLGVSVTRLDAETLRTSGGLQRTVADKGASLLRSFQGLRVAYRVESRVSEMTGSAPLPGR